MRWREGWTKQVWHWCNFLAESGQLNRDKKLELATFLLGRFAAAFWLRLIVKNFCSAGPFAAFSKILSWCNGSNIAPSDIGQWILPAVGSFASSAIPDPGHVCVISLNGKFRRVRSETLLDLASAWHRSKLIETVAPYSWGPSSLTVSGHAVPILAARVAPGFFQVLGLRAVRGRTLSEADEQACNKCLVLSDQIWRLQFHSDPAIVGRTVTLDGTDRIVIGMLPRNFHLLSPEIAAWTLLDSHSPPFSNFVERIGAVARMEPGATQQRVETELADLTENAGYVIPASMLAVTSGTAEMHRYLVYFALFVLLAVICAMLIVYARSGPASDALPRACTIGLRWWSFFVAKSVLLLLVHGTAGMEPGPMAVDLPVGDDTSHDQRIAVWLFLMLSVAPLSWAINDQQRRCRVCLQRLGTPIQLALPDMSYWTGQGRK